MKKILYIFPYNLTKDEVGGAFSYQLVQKLSQRNKIDVVLFHNKGEEINAKLNQNVTIIWNEEISTISRLKGWFFNPTLHPIFASRHSLKLERLISKRADSYDYIIFDYSQTFSLARKINHPHKILIMHDVIYQRFEREGARFLSWIKRTEKKLLNDYEILYSFSEKDCELIKRLYNKKCYVTPVFIKDSIIKKTADSIGDYHIFFGDWSRMDNSESLEWFIRNVCPKLSSLEKIKVIGGRMPDSVNQLISQTPNVEYLGFVDDPYQIIANAKSEISPLHKGAGIKVKCLEALACGTKVIGTEIAFEGIDSMFGESLLLANTPEEYVERIQSLDDSLEDKQKQKDFFINNYSQKSIINYIEK